MLPLKLIYDDRYDLNLGAHVFPSQKYRLVYERLLQDGIASQEDFLKPAPASDEDILRVHSQDYLYKLKTGSLTRAEVMRMEVPYSAELIEACWLAAGGSILSARRALGRWLFREYRWRIPSCVSRSWRRVLRDSRCGSCYPKDASRRCD